MKFVRLVTALVLLVGASAVGGIGGRATAVGFTAGPVEYVKTIPFDAGSAWGGRVVGNYFYVGSYRHFSIYDVSDPVNPELVSTTPLVGQGLTMEDIDTNGKVLVLTAQRQIGDELQVWDVSDKAAPAQIATVAGAGDHTMTCVLDCKWAYGSAPDKSIVDLRIPQNPKLVGTWQDLGVDYVHDVTEVAPGWVVASTAPLMYIDARNPGDPRLVAWAEMQESLGPPTQQKIVGSSRWPRAARDRFLLVGHETPFSGQCGATSATLQVYDASRWRSHNRLQVTGAYHVHNGSYTDGNPPANVVGCSALWFQPHPDFHNGGMVAAAFAENGMRLIEVTPRGVAKELGYYVPLGGISSAAYWISDEVVYSMDLTRGFDILRIGS